MQAALSDDFFGSDGNGDPAEPNVADTAATADPNVANTARAGAEAIAKAVAEAGAEAEAEAGAEAEAQADVQAEAEAEVEAETVIQELVPNKETVIQELVRTLPDAQVDLRDELLQALSERLERRTSGTKGSPQPLSSVPAREEEAERVDAEMADAAALPVSTKTENFGTERYLKKKKKKKQKKTGRQVAEGR